jgi:hypothetical protein
VEDGGWEPVGLWKRGKGEGQQRNSRRKRVEKGLGSGLGMDPEVYGWKVGQGLNAAIL